MKKAQLRFEIAHLAHDLGKSRSEIQRFLNIAPSTLSHYLVRESYEEFTAVNKQRQLEYEAKKKTSPIFRKWWRFNGVTIFK